MKFTFLKRGKSSRVVMTLYQNYKNLSIYINVKNLSTESAASQAAQSRANQKTEVGPLCWCEKLPGETARITRGETGWLPGAWKSCVLGGGSTSSSRKSQYFSLSLGDEKRILLFWGIDSGSSFGCQAWLEGPAQTGHVLQPGSELVP